MKFTQTLFTLLAVTIACGGAMAASTPNYSSGDLISTSSPYDRVGGDKVIFGYKVASGCDDAALIKAATSIKNHTSTDRWDNQWYAFSVPSGRCLVMGFYNLTNSQYGYVAIQNKPNTWGVRSNTSGWQDIGNGAGAKYDYSINSQKVVLNVFNPKNEGALTGNDILISFGY